MRHFTSHSETGCGERHGLLFPPQGEDPQGKRGLDAPQAGKLPLQRAEPPHPRHQHQPQTCPYAPIPGPGGGGREEMAGRSVVEGPETGQPGHAGGRGPQGLWEFKQQAEGTGS